MSRVFWCLFDDAILREVPVRRFKNGRGVQVGIGKGCRCTGRVRSPVVLSHHIGVTVVGASQSSASLYFAIFCPLFLSTTTRISSLEFFEPKARLSKHLSSPRI